MAALRRDDELRRLELRLEREESERESRESRASREDREDRERRESLLLSESVSSSSPKSSLSLFRDALERELREEDEPNESLLRDDRCAWTGSTVHAANTPAASVTRRQENNTPRRLDLMLILRRSAAILVQR